MKTLNIHFDDEEIERLEKRKGDLSWKEFILTLVPKESETAIEEPTEVSE